MGNALTASELDDVRAGIAEGFERLERAKPAPDPERDARVERAAADVEWFGRYYLPNYFTDEPAGYHAQVDAAIAKRRLVAPAEPRGHGKTTRTLRRRALQEAATGLAPYIVIVRRSEEDRDQTVLWLREQFEANERLRADFGDLTGGQPWQDSVFVLQNGVKVEGLTMGEPILGKLWREHRPHRIYIDDPQTMSDVYSETIRAKHRRWLDNEAIPALARDGKLVIRQNMIHEDCLIGHAHENAMFWSEVYDAILSEPDRADLWEEWESIYRSEGGAESDRHDRADRFYVKHEPEMLRGAEVLWPEHVSYRELQMLRIAIGDIVFWTQVRNKPFTGDKAEWLQWCKPGAVPDFAERIEGFDLASSQEATAAKTARVRIAVDKSRTVYVEEAEEGRMTFAEQLYQVTEPGHPLLSTRVIESNQFQAVLGQTAKEHSLQGGATVVNHPSTLAPELRSLKLWRLMQNGKMLFVEGSPAVAKLAQQLCAYRAGHMPDLVSALDQAISYLLTEGEGVAMTLGVHT